MRCLSLQIHRLVHGPLSSMHAGKYDMQNLPAGPRGQLFKQLLPEVQPLLDVLQQVADTRGKTMSQVWPWPGLLQLFIHHN